jgi:type I restriction enzyme S subunit
MPKLSQSHIKSWRMLCPPFEEQKNIVASIHSQTSPLDVVLARVEKEIELLREYRTRLTSDVVTGKLDVRQAAARLPDDTPPEPTPDDVDAIPDDSDADEEEPIE